MYYFFFQIVMTLCFIIGVYFITSQPLDVTRFGMILLVAVLVALVSQSFGLLIGAAFNIEVTTKYTRNSNSIIFNHPEFLIYVVSGSLKGKIPNWRVPICYGNSATLKERFVDLS